MNPTFHIDEEGGLTLAIPGTAALLEAMDLRSKQALVCYLACDPELFEKVVDLLADGFCTETEDDWRPWYPGTVPEARAKLDGRLDDVAKMRVVDLEHQIERLKGDIAREKEWENAYKQVLARYCGGDYSAAHRLAMEQLDMIRGRA